MKMDSVIFREYDIRGVYDVQYDLAFAESLGRAIVTYHAKNKNISKPTITIGQDARLSSPDIVKALARGILSSGGNAIHLGLVTTPISYFSTFSMPNVDGSVMVTGSHNPPEYNGFKLSVGRSTIFGQDIKALEKIIVQKEFLKGVGQETEFDILPSYIERYKTEFGVLKPIPCVLDCGNGAAGSVARRLYEAVGLKPKILFENPDGHFPNHHPDPTVEENLTALKAEVLKCGAVTGIGFDGDADRIGVVDETGRMLLGDELMALLGRFVLSEHPNAPIIGDVKCSDRMYSYLNKYGGEPIMWKTGHSLIKQKVKDEKSPFGGELSGHIFFADKNYGYDDAPYAGLRLMQILSQTGKKISELLADFPQAYTTSEIRIDTTEEKKVSIVERVRTHFSKPRPGVTLNLIDGIRISFPNGWALVRASNTQPVLVMRFESDSQEGLNKIRGEIEGVVNPIL
jgi:phosphomannomutase/phosphomannomutase/phosphoglucomutase